MNNKIPIVGATWEDAHGSDGTIFAHEVDHKPYIYTTVGFLVRSDEIGVSIASEMGEDGKYRDITFIPRKMVIKEFPISPKTSKLKRKSRDKNPPLHPTTIDPSPHKSNQESGSTENDSKP